MFISINGLHFNSDFHGTCARVYDLSAKTNIPDRSKGGQNIQSTNIQVNHVLFFHRESYLSTEAVTM